MPDEGLIPRNQTLIDAIDNIDYKSLKSGVMHKFYTATEVVDPTTGVVTYDSDRVSAQEVAKMFVGQLGYHVSLRDEKLFDNVGAMDAFMGQYERDGRNVFMDALVHQKFGVDYESLEELFEKDHSEDAVAAIAGRAGSKFLQDKLGKKVENVFGNDAGSYKNGLGNLKAVLGVGSDFSDDDIANAGKKEAKDIYLNALMEALKNKKKI